MPPRGVATYRLIVRTTPDERRLALMIGRPLSVAKVWVNGRLLGETGTVGIDQPSESPRNHVLLRSFANAGDTLTIVLQISNHHNVQGGPQRPHSARDRNRAAALDPAKLHRPRPFCAGGCSSWR